MCRPVGPSSAEKTSSRSSRRGKPYAARASATRCFCPPDRVTPRSPMIVWSACGNAARSCRRLHASRTVKKRAASQGRPKTTLSRSDMFCTHGTCAQKAIPSAGSRGTPWQWVRASPSRPASSEDFPEATPPATSSSSPSHTRKLAPRTAATPGTAPVSALALTLAPAVASAEESCSEGPFHHTLS
eukprot:scaffold48809_cov75-Phaeocystis_antarctica.AAC.2